MNTTIESEQNGDMMLNDLLPRAFNILSKSEQMDKAVESVLELLGERLQVSRAYVFENSRMGPATATPLSGAPGESGPRRICCRMFLCGVQYRLPELL